MSVDIVQIESILEALQQRRVHHQAVARDSTLLASAMAADSWSQSIQDSMLADERTCRSKKDDFHKIKDGFARNCAAMGLDPQQMHYLASTHLDVVYATLQRIPKIKAPDTKPTLRKSKNLSNVTLGELQSRLLPEFGQCFVATAAYVTDCQQNSVLWEYFEQLPSAKMPEGKIGAASVGLSFVRAFLTGHRRVGNEDLANTVAPNFQQRCAIMEKMFSGGGRINIAWVEECHRTVMDPYKTVIAQSDLHNINSHYVVPMMRKLREICYIDHLYDKIASTSENAGDILPSVRNPPSEGAVPKFQSAEYEVTGDEDPLRFLVMACENSLSPEFRTKLYEELQRMPYIEGVRYRVGSLVNVVTSSKTTDTSKLYFPISSMGSTPVWYGATEPWPMQERLFQIVHLLEEMVIVAQLLGVEKSPHLRAKKIPEWKTNVAVTTVNTPSLNYSPHSDRCPTNTTVAGEDAMEIGLPPPTLLRTLTFVTVKQEHIDSAVSRYKLKVTVADKEQHQLRHTSPHRNHVSFSCGDHWQLEGSQFGPVRHAPVRDGNAAGTGVIRFVTSFRRMCLPNNRDNVQEGFVFSSEKSGEASNWAEDSPSLSLHQRREWICRHNAASPTYANKYVTFPNGVESFLLSERTNTTDVVEYSSGLVGRPSDAATDGAAVAAETLGGRLVGMEAGWEDFRDSYEKVVVGNISREVFDGHNLDDRTPQCRTAVPASEIVSHHDVVRGLFRKEEAFVPYIWWSEKYPEKESVPCLPLQRNGRLYRPGEFYDKAAVFLRQGTQMKLSSRSRKWFREQEEPFVNIIVLTHPYKSHIDSVLETWEWALVQDACEFTTSEPYGAVYGGSFRSYFSGGSHQPGDLYDPDISKVAAAYVLHNGQKVEGPGGSNFNYQLAARKGSVFAVFLDVTSFCDELTVEDTAPYPHVDVVRELYRLEGSAKEASPKLLFLNYTVPANIVWEPGAVVPLRFGNYSTFLTGPHYHFSVDPFITPEEWTTFLGREEQMFDVEGYTPIMVDEDSCGQLTMPMTKDDREGGLTMLMHDMRDYVVRTGYRQLVAAGQKRTEEDGIDDFASLHGNDGNSTGSGMLRRGISYG